MSWTYTPGDTLSAKDQVRFLIGDTDSQQPLMQDEEISFALKQKSNDVNGAAILCCWAIMASLAKEVQYKVGPEHVFAEQRYQQYKQLYEELQKTTQQDTAIPSGSIPDDDTSAFDVGMFDYK